MDTVKTIDELKEYRKQLEYQEKVNSPEYKKRRADRNAR